jgi:chromosome segregation ATPase
VDAKAKTLVIEHGQRAGYTLMDRKPTETTPSAYRFEVKLAASGTETFPVREERVYSESVSVNNLTPDVLAAYVQNKTLSEAARRQLDQFAQKKREVAGDDALLRQADADLNSLSQDQTRMRSDIESLNRVSGQQDQVQQYARQLAAAETKLAGLRDTQSDLRKKKAALEAELNALMERIEF